MYQYFQDRITNLRPWPEANVSRGSIIATMIEGLTKGGDIYYRGYQIHRDIRSICYTVYGPRPLRQELAVVGRSQEAMRWIDRRIKEEKHRDMSSGIQPPLWQLLGPAPAPANG